MPKTKSRPARPAPTERTSRRPRLHAAARDEPQSVVQAATPQARSSPVEQSAPQAPTTSVCTIPVTEPPVPTGNLTLVPLDSNHTILPLPVGSTQFSLGYYVDPSTRDKIISGACTRPNCQYVHRCLRCNNAHSSNTCSLATPTQATKVNRPFRFNTPNQGHHPYQYNNNNPSAKFPRHPKQ
uniref:Uncharacterized protein n=1 Tax=Magallana gigas TaxID=29159 RepID=A0A8W8HZ60_MAGGI